jgi:hypothetical protein
VETFLEGGSVYKAAFRMTSWFQGGVNSPLRQTVLCEVCMNMIGHKCNIIHEDLLMIIDKTEIYININMSCPCYLFWRLKRSRKKGKLI